MSNRNWRDLFEEYRTGHLSEEKWEALMAAMENNDDLRAEYELFFTIQEGLDTERIRNKVLEIRKNTKHNRGKKFTAFNSFLLAFTAAVLCLIAYWVIMNRPVEATKEEQAVIQETAPNITPTDSIKLQELPIEPMQIDQKKKIKRTQPTRSSTEQPMASAAPGIQYEQLASRYISQKEIIQPLLRGGNESDNAIAKQVEEYIKSGRYLNAIKLLTVKEESEGIHPDDRIWFLALAYLGNGEIDRSQKSLKEIASDDFNSHHKIATQLLAEIDMLQ